MSMSHEEMERARREGRVRVEVRTEQGYGPFPGGDPRRFTPDEECSTPGERERWKLACQEAERGEGLDRAPHCQLMGDASNLLGHGFGLGVYTVEIEWHVVTHDDGSIEEFF